MIVDDIVQASDTYREKYGPQTVCLYQIGDFFEMNAYYENTKLRGVDIHTVCNILNIQVTRKNKAVVETTRANPMMAGFPLAALQKYTSMLLASGWTIVVVRQVTPPPNVTRAVTDIMSPGTTVMPSCADSNYLLCVFFEPYTDVTTRKTVMTVGVAGVDVSTGNTFTYEAYASVEDPHCCYDEVYRLLGTYLPRELLVITANKHQQNQNQHQNQHQTHQTSIEINNCIQLNNKSDMIVHRRSASSVQSPGSINTPVEDTLLHKAFKTDVGLDQYMLARTALNAVISFAYEHNETIVERLKLPTHIQQNKYLTLQYNAASQLDVTGTGSEKPLLSILNRCATAFGRRRFKERLLTPIHDTTILEQRYAAVEAMLCDHKYMDVSQNMTHIGDLERMVRKIRLGTFSPIDWTSLHMSLECAKRVCPAEDIAPISQTQAAYMNILDLDQTAKYLLGDIRGSVFKPGYSKDVDELSARLQSHVAILKNIESHMCEIEPCTLDYSERDGHFINITKRRWENIKTAAASATSSATSSAKPKPFVTTDFVAKPISAGSTCLHVTSPAMVDASAKIAGLQGAITRVVTEAYMRFLVEFDAECGDMLENLANVLADIDVAATCAKNAAEYKYTRPVLCGSTGAGAGAAPSAGAFVEASAMRHPVIEHIHTDVEYVPNDVALGRGADASACASAGLLLYGLNSSGKSSYMKAIGLNVIMAQAGMYVAADTMRLSPYHSLFTRIQNNDNVYKRMSSFTVEMTELRNIFQRCDEYSLVLGDELCSGTESVSATSIVAAGTHLLVSRGVSFVFATHLHELVDIPLIMDMCEKGHTQVQSLRVAHIHVETKEDGSLIYHRKLREGSGSSIYGLEVCAALGMPRDFVNMAHDIRRFIQNDVGLTTSMCHVCEKAAAVDVHHIQYQRNGGNNRKSNLVSLCKQCHDEEHNGNLHILGYVSTSEGRKLTYEWRAPYVEPQAPKEEPHDPQDPNTERLVRADIERLKPFLRYGVQGWMIKRTVRSNWRPIGKDSLLAFVTKKLGGPIDYALLTSGLLVI